MKRREYDRDLHCDVVRVFGYEAVCTCGDGSGRKASVSAARVWMRGHREDCPGVREVRA